MKIRVILLIITILLVSVLLGLTHMEISQAESDSDADDDSESDSDADDDSESDSDAVDNKPEDKEESNMSSMLVVYDNSVKYNLVRLMGNYATALGIPVLEKRINYDSKYLPGTFPDNTIDIEYNKNIEYIVIFSKDITGLNVIIDYVTSYESLNNKKIIVSSDIGEKMLKQHALILQKAASPEYLIITDLKDSDLVWDAILTSSIQKTPVTGILDKKILNIQQ